MKKPNIYIIYGALIFSLLGCIFKNPQKKDGPYQPFLGESHQYKKNYVYKIQDLVDITSAKVFPDKHAKPIIDKFIDSDWHSGAWIRNNFEEGEIRSKVRILDFRDMKISMPILYDYKENHYDMAKLKEGGIEYRIKNLDDIKTCVFIAGRKKLNYMGWKIIRTNNMSQRNELMKAFIAVGVRYDK